MSFSIFVGRVYQRQIEELVIDATIREHHEYTNEVTDYPVEDGFNVTDHVKQQPERLTIEGLTTNSPLDEPIDIIARDDNSDRIQVAYNYLLELAGYEPPKQSGIPSQKIRDPQIIDIVTGLKTYTNMIITKLTIPVTARTGQAINYTVEIKKIKKVQPEYTYVPKVSELDGRAPNIDNQASKTQDAGVKKTEEVKDGTVLSRKWDEWSGKYGSSYIGNTGGLQFQL